MTTLKIYTCHSDKLIVTINNIDQLIKEYEIDPQSYNFEEEFETEVLGDIFEEECLNSSHVYYELI
jgi:hypothetical protein